MVPASLTHFIAQTTETKQTKTSLDELIRTAILTIIAAMVFVSRTPIGFPVTLQSKNQMSP